MSTSTAIGKPNRRILLPVRRPRVFDCRMAANAHRRAAWLLAASSAFCVSLSLVTVFARVPDIGKRLIEVWRHVSGPRQRVPDESRPPRVQRLLCPPRGNGL